MRPSRTVAAAPARIGAAGSPALRVGSLTVPDGGRRDRADPQRARGGALAPRAAAARRGARARRRGARRAAGARAAWPRPEAAAADPNLADATLQAFFDTIIPGRPVDCAPSSATRSTRRRSPASTPSPARSRPTRCCSPTTRRSASTRSAPAFLADLEARSLTAGRPLPRPRLRGARARSASAGSPSRTPTGSSGRPAAAIPFTAFCAAANISATRPASTAAGYEVMGHPGTAPHGYQDFSYRRRLNRGRTREGVPAADGRAGRRLHRRLGLRRLDRRLAAGRALPRRRPGRRACVVLERGLRKGHTDFRQSMDVDHLSDVYGLIQGQGAQIVVANLVGGGSNLYLAASLRSPSETFERTRPPPRRRPRPAACGRRQISRRTLDPFYRARRGWRCGSASRPGSEVSKSGGVWAAMLREAGHTCDRVPLAIDFERCVDAKWCYTGCVFGAKNSLITNYLASAERGRGRGAAAGPGQRGRAVERAALPLARPRRHGRPRRPSRRPEPIEDIECKVLILAAGAMGTPPILMRSRRRGALPAISLAPRPPPRRQRRPRRRDRVSTRSKVRAACSACRGYGAVPQGQADHDDELRLLGRQARQPPRRHPLHAPGDPALPAHQLPLRRRRAATASEPSWWGREKKRSISTWSQPHRDPGDGRGHPRRRVLRRAARRRRPRAAERRPGRDRPLRLRASPSSRCGSASAADAAIKRIVERRGLGRFLKLTETPGVYASHPLGGCRMADDDRPRRRRRRLRGLRLRGPLLHGLLGDPDQPRRQPVADDLRGLRARRRAARARAAADFGLPAPPPGFRHRPPGVHRRPATRVRAAEPAPDGAAGAATVVRPRWPTTTSLEVRGHIAS